MARATRALVVTAATVAVLALAGCSDSSGGSSGRPATSGPSATRSPRDPLPDLRLLASRAAAASFSTLYALDSIDPKRSDATVGVYKLAAAYRIDVRTSAGTSLLVTTSRGLAACQVSVRARTCLLVAPRGGTPPRLFDPGLQRVFTTSLKAMAVGKGLRVTESSLLTQTESLPSARCFSISGPGVDSGEYCLTEGGLVRRATFPSGTLTLSSIGAVPGPSLFVAPVIPTPLPR